MTLVEQGFNSDKVRNAMKYVNNGKEYNWGFT